MVKEQMCLVGQGIRVNIVGKVMEAWAGYRQVSEDAHESFGVLIGTCSSAENTFWIDSVTTPYPDDRSSRSHFHLQDRGHQDAVNLDFQHSSGRSVYLGTWHTHPEKIPSPSRIDTQDWHECMKRNPGRQLFFVIVGTNHIHVYVANGIKFEPLTLNRD